MSFRHKNLNAVRRHDHVRCLKLSDLMIFLLFVSSLLFMRDHMSSGAQTWYVSLQREVLRIQVFLNKKHD